MNIYKRIRRIPADYVFDPWDDEATGTITNALRMLWEAVLCLVVGHKAQLNDLDPSDPFITCSRCHGKWEKREKR